MKNEEEYFLEMMNLKGKEIMKEDMVMYMTIHNKR
jgi:hypothetical protein